jgi:lipopolysaccharide/colanic/teichoic acid biosynthesis glycosyltransferase
MIVGIECGCHVSEATPSVAPSSAGDPGNSHGYPACKSAVDAILAVGLFILTLPFMVVAMVLMKLTSRGPAIYRQTRVGHRGRLFTIYKIRTMVQDSERLTGPRWSLPGDPRVTPVGRFLRATHLDELPQLWNVLRGEMSLVGPRPERPEFVAQFERVIPCYRDRLLVRPGVTGLAQVQLPPDTDLNSVFSKLACDLYYVQRIGPWLDLRIILSTASAVVGIPFAVPRTLLRIPSGSAVDAAYRDLSAKANPVLQMQSA